MDINELQYPYIIIESLKNNHLQHNFGCKRVKMIGYGNNSTSITECYSDGYKIQRLFAAIEENPRSPAPSKESTPRGRGFENCPP
jgi:hypothetical protein